MIRYDVPVKEIKRSIRQSHPNWMYRASNRTRILRKAGRFEDRSPIWSEIKDVFIAIQFRKCIFCERQFEGPEVGKIEYDIEHFRPKSEVNKWPEGKKGDLSYSFSTGSDNKHGYYWLAYELRNYAVSCKNCNTPLKSSYFPIAKSRAKRLASLKSLNAEKAFLCYPIGDIDDDPEDLIGFKATTAIPKAADAAKRQRGQIIIDFFQLNDREQLHRERAQMILLLGVFLDKISRGQGDKNDEAVVKACIASEKCHSSCLRSFKCLWETDIQDARRILLECQKYFSGLGGIPAI